MTERELLNTLLEKSLRKRGENGFLVQHLRAQLHSLDRFEPLEKAYHQFHIGTSQGPPEDDPKYPEGHPANYREDMYGEPGAEPGREGRGSRRRRVNQLDAQKFQGGATAKNASFRRKTPKQLPNLIIRHHVSSSQHPVHQLAASHGFEPLLSDHQL